MAYSSLTRNLRDGQITVRDGTAGTPIEAVLVTSEGDMTWTETDATIEVLNRGLLGHTRPGNHAALSLSFSVKWTQLIQGTVASSDGYVLYEMFNQLDTIFESTSGCGEQFTLEVEFVVNAPCTATATVGETITFAKVFKETFECSEGDEYNTVAFTGKSFERRPVISRNT